LEAGILSWKNHSYKGKKIILNQVKKIIPNQGPLLSKEERPINQEF